ncbi:O-antigen ligase family protein [Bhargavaea ginsengi]|uniref:O-antigen ligase family protein n=1 Tax=Bhargavaea ginsengi TaxID=426757 RepID=UPI00203E348F|nr:O-antigen ligase family protein [Bhargavaea ginsengi]MCM3088667.1 O-antigen ligase family protein [Bhargavaea ginsengi]
MTRNSIAFFLILFLILFDFLFFNIDIIFINITLLRLFLFGLLFIYLLSFLNRNRFLMNKRMKPPLYFLTFWIIYLFISLAWTENHSNIHKGIYYLVLYSILVFLIIKLINSEKNIINANQSILLLSYLIIGIGIFEYLSGYHLSTSRYSDPRTYNSFNVDNINAVTATFYNENNYSLFLSICAPFIMIQIIKGNLITKLVNLLMLSSIFFLVIINDAKLVLAGLILQTIILLIFFKIPRLIKLTYTFVFFVLTLYIVNTGFLDEYNKAYDEIVNGYGSNYVRLNLYKSGFYMLLESNFLGVGPKNFGLNLHPELYTAEIVNPHNWWIELLAEYGVIIFIGFLALYIWILIQLYKIYRQKRITSDITFALFLSFCGFVIASVAPSSLFDFWPMWVIIGLALAIINVHYLKKEI